MPFDVIRDYFWDAEKYLLYWEDVHTNRGATNTKPPLIKTQKCKGVKPGDLKGISKLHPTSTNV